MTPYYEHAGITIYHGDCVDVLKDYWLDHTKDDVPELVLADPPYGKVNRQGGGLRTLDKGSADIVTVHPRDVVDMVAPLGAGTHYFFCATEQVGEYRESLVEYDMTTRLCVWEKTNPSPMNGQHLWLSSIEACVFGRRSGAVFNEFCASPVWRGPTDLAQEHPTQKPLWLMKRLIGASTNPGDLVLDPFMGSGTTLRAAKDLVRRAIGIEIEEKYCEIAARRLSQEVLPLVPLAPEVERYCVCGDNERNHTNSGCRVIACQCGEFKEINTTWFN